MTKVNNQDNLREMIKGSLFSVQELHTSYQIPIDEIKSFQHCICIVPYRAVIFEEGDSSKDIYLLRSGTVSISKQAERKQEQIATIDAVNFVGEMSLINNEPRSATVSALSKNVLVYKISRPNLPIILKNPKWAELLVTRLCKNLANTNEQLVAASNKVSKLNAEIETQALNLEAEHQAMNQEKDKTRLAFNGILHLQKVVQELAVVESKGWAYLNTLSRLSRALINNYLPDIELSEKEFEINVVRNCLADIENDSQKAIIEDIKPLI